MPDHVHRLLAQRAAARGTTLEQLVRDALVGLTGVTHPARIPRAVADAYAETHP